MVSRLRKLLRVALCRSTWRGLPAGVLASMEHREVLLNLRQFGIRTIVDIGANRGQFALAAHALVPDATIYSFEPLDTAARRFNSLFENHPGVRLYQVAIGAENGQSVIHVSGRDDSSSLLPIGELQTEMFPGTAEVRNEPTRVMRLPDVLDAADIAAPALLKIDVQGYELQVLQGCRELLRQFAFAYVECSFVPFYVGQALATNVINLLADENFNLNGIYNLCYGKTGNALQGDFLFVNEVTAAESSYHRSARAIAGLDACPSTEFHNR